MNWWDALILGIVQGLTEFLPVSSSGHLVVFQSLLGIDHHDVSFDLVVHVGTLFSILYFYRREILGLAKANQTPGQSCHRNRIILAVMMALVPTGLVGFFAQDFLRGLFDNIRYTGFFFLVTAALLLIPRSKKMDLNEDSPHIYEGLAKITWKVGLLIGLAQSVAIAPGISRSGSTIVAGLALGLSRPVAAFFSFLIAIPTILGAASLEVIQHNVVWSHWPALLTGFLFSLFSGIVGLKVVVKMLNKGRLNHFSYYLIPLAIFIIVRSFI